MPSNDGAAWAPLVTRIVDRYPSSRRMLQGSLNQWLNEYDPETIRLLDILDPAP